MLKKQPWLAAPAAAFGILILILDSRTALAAASEGISLCVKTIIPALFPFIFLSGVFSAHCPETGRLSRLLGKLFCVPKGLEPILVPALLGGYPVGAQCVYESYKAGGVPLPLAERALAFCSNVGPAFIFGILPASFSHGATVWVIWGIQIFSILCAAFLFSVPQCAAAPHAAADSFGIEQAIWAMLKICGWVILFRVVIGFSKRWFLWMFSSTVQVFIVGVLELSNGCCMLRLISNENTRFIICNILLSFGGFCVLYQTISVCPGLSIRFYLCGKLVQALASAVAAVAMVLHLWILIPIWGAFLFLLKNAEKKVEIRRTVMYNGQKDGWRTGHAVSQKN